METGIITLVGLIVSPAIGYIIGKQQEIDKHRVAKVNSYIEEISILIHEIHAQEKYLIAWYEGNFSGLEFRKAMEYFYRYRNSDYEAQVEKIHTLLDKRSELTEKIRLSRVYLNSKDLDLIEKYLELGCFYYVTDGGIFKNTIYEAFFDNLLNNVNRKLREKWYIQIKNRVPRMYESEGFSKLLDFIRKYF